jgi:hypothetical protein
MDSSPRLKLSGIDTDTDTGCARATVARSDSVERSGPLTSCAGGTPADLMRMITGGPDAMVMIDVGVHQLYRRVVVVMYCIVLR